VPLTSDTVKERTSGKHRPAPFTAAGDPGLGGRPSPHFPQGDVPCRAGEAAASPIRACPIWGLTGQGCAKQFPQGGFSAKRFYPSARRKGLLYGCSVTVPLVLVQECGTSCQGIPSRMTVPTGILTSGWVSPIPP